MTEIQTQPTYLCITDYNDLEEIDLDTTKLNWLGTKISLGETAQEQLETRQAIEEQKAMGILDILGIPVGFTYEELGIPKDQAFALEERRKQLQMQSNQNGVQKPQPQRIRIDPAERAKMARIAQDADNRAKRLAESNKIIQSHQQASAPKFASNPFIRK